MSFKDFMRAVWGKRGCYSNRNYKKFCKCYIVSMEYGELNEIFQNFNAIGDR